MDLAFHVRRARRAAAALDLKGVEGDVDEAVLQAPVELTLGADSGDQESCEGAQEQQSTDGHGRPSPGTIKGFSDDVMRRDTFDAATKG